MVDFWKEKYDTKETLSGQYFTFEILKNEENINISLKSAGHCGREYQPVDKYELKELAEFILKYLEKN